MDLHLQKDQIHVSICPCGNEFTIKAGPSTCIKNSPELVCFLSLLYDDGFVDCKYRC